jgi:hypothetical protein
MIARPADGFREWRSDEPLHEENEVERKLSWHKLADRCGWTGICFML